MIGPDLFILGLSLQSQILWNFDAVRMGVK